MEFPFPPPPDGYTSVIVFRRLLLAWLIVQFGFLAWRLNQWKNIRGNELAWWLAAWAISSVLYAGGLCRTLQYDNNRSLEPYWVAAVALVAAGVVSVLTKLRMYEKLESSHYYTLVAIVCALAALVYETPRADWTSGRRETCRYNLKEIGLGIHNYHDEWKRFPAAASGDPVWSWRVTLLPYLDHKQIYDSYDFSLAWNAAPNATFATERVTPYDCSSNRQPQDTQGRWFTAYSMPTGPRTVGASPTGTAIRDIADGTSNTLLVVEACGAQIVWTEPRDVDVGVQPTGINLKGNAPGHSAGWLSSYHAGGTQALLADGSVRFVSAKSDPDRKSVV